MYKAFFCCLFLVLSSSFMAFSSDELTLANQNISISWKKSSKGWKISTLKLNNGANWDKIKNSSGASTLIYSAQKPSDKPDRIFKTNTGVEFPEKLYQSQLKKKWDQSTTAVALNTAGEAFQFYPETAEKQGDKIVFKQTLSVGTVTTTWSLNPDFPTDVMVTQQLEVTKDGYFSMASPTLTTVKEKNLKWVTVPGYFQGNKVSRDVVAAYGYGHGIPNLPVIYRERAASTLSPMITSTDGFTLAVIPAPGLARDPWEKDQNTHQKWNIGLSHMNRFCEFSPTLYYPVLGEPKSELKKGETINYNFRYSLSTDDWFKTLNHAIYDVYDFKKALDLRKNTQSLTERVTKIHEYVVKPATSLWKVDDYNGTEIGAQAYLGAVVGSSKDAIKNSDYGAMWMMGAFTKDTAITEGRLPFALNFKLAQQQTEDGFFKGAVKGQYYLYKSNKWVEEFGSIMEPIGVTYYSIADMANILLFTPNNNLLKERIKTSADLLLNWQLKDGSWTVAYDHETKQEVFKDVKDLRPTFYGLLVAFQVTKDRKYLDGAIKGADWLVKNAVETGSFLGVCGDMRYETDFATAQAAQALLELYDITGNNNYKNAAITTAKIYTASIYTHPIADTQKKTVRGIEREDWEIAQAGLSFEHGGILGSANNSGPITLCSHAGMFVRMYELTKEQLFLDMARAAAIGRDAFLSPETSVASYYWNQQNKGPGPFPHHAWWQVGWIYDYLMSEIKMRSQDRVIFPRGYITPKVGPHQTYGFAAGKVFGEEAMLISSENLLTCDNPQIEYIAARSVKNDKIFVFLLNDEGKTAKTELKWDKALARYKNVELISNGKSVQKSEKQGALFTALSGYGLTTIVLTK